MKNNINLKPLLERDLQTQIKQILVSRNFDGSYTLFGKYKIVSDELGLYKATIVNETEYKLGIFSSLKNAVTWCTLDQRKLLKETKLIQELDNFIASLDVEIERFQKKILTCESYESKVILQSRLYESKLKKLKAIKQIEQLVQDSKYWQAKKFAESQPKNTEAKDKYSLQEWKNNHEIKRL